MWLPVLVHVFLFLIFWVVIVPFLYFVCTKCWFKHLHGFWYLKRNSEIGQWFNLKEWVKARKACTTRLSTARYVHNSMLAAFSTLESSKEYFIETHFLQYLLRFKKIHILGYQETKKRYVWETAFYWGVPAYLSKRLSKSNKTDSEIYKQFYKIQFKKL